MSQRIKIATLQPALRAGQVMSNMFALRQAVENLPTGIDFILLPEMWTGLSPGQDDGIISQQAVQFLQNLARARQVNLIGGSFERLNAQGQRHNVCLVMSRRGDTVGEYVKQTLFGNEQAVRERGTSTGLFELDGIRFGVMICADLWLPELTRRQASQMDLLFVTARTGVPSDTHVEYARMLWHSLALTRAMENGVAVIVSDWAAGRHSLHDVDKSVGSVHAPGMSYDRGVLYKRPRGVEDSPTASGPVVPTATAHSSAEPALGVGVHFTAGAACICDPSHRPDIGRIWRTLHRGEPGYLNAEIDLVDLNKYRHYRRQIGLLPS